MINVVKIVINCFGNMRENKNFERSKDSLSNLRFQLGILFFTPNKLQHQTLCLFMELIWTDIKRVFGEYLMYTTCILLNS